MVEQAKYAQTNAEEKLKYSNQTVNKPEDLIYLKNNKIVYFRFMHLLLKIHT
jgi:hypothetical protein